MIPRTPRPHRIVPVAKRGPGSRTRRRGCRGGAFLPILRADQAAGAHVRAGETARGETGCRTCSPTISSRRPRRNAPTPARLLAGSRGFDAYKVGAQGPDVFFYSRLVRGRRGRPTSPTSRTSTRWPRRSAACSTRAASLAGGGARRRLRLRRAGTPRTCVWTPGPTRGCSTGRGTSPTELIRRPGPRPSAGTGSSRRPSTSSSPANGPTTPPGCAEQRLLRLPPAQATTAARLLSGMLSDVHGVTFTPRGGTLGLPRHGVGLHDDERSALPADAASRDGRPRGRQGRRRAHPDLPGDTRRLPPPASTRSGAPGTTPRCRTNRAPRRSRRSSRAATAETARCLRAIVAVADRDAAVDEAVAVIGDRSMFTGVACDDPRPLVAFAPGREELWGEA